MRKIALVAVLLNIMLFLSGCDLIGGIFKAGMIWGIFLVLLIVGVIIYFITKGRR